MIVTAPISVGELLDKITILQIKTIFLGDESKLKNVNLELIELLNIFDGLDIPDVSDLVLELKEVNTQLWNIEDFKRRCEREKNFGPEFVEAARKVYLKNDIRARIKRDINIKCGSTIIEEKSHANV